MEFMEQIDRLICNLQTMSPNDKHNQLFKYLCIYVFDTWSGDVA